MPAFATPPYQNTSSGGCAPTVRIVFAQRAIAGITQQLTTKAQRTLPKARHCMDRAQEMRGMPKRFGEVFFDRSVHPDGCASALG
jgi:hypothetical protein